MERRLRWSLARACCSLLAALCALGWAAAEASSGRSWLKAYGYLLPSESRMSALHSGKAMQSAVATMQQFYGIPVTGVLDQTTIEISIEATENRSKPPGCTAAAQSALSPPLSSDY